MRLKDEHEERLMQARATKQKLDFEKAVADRKASDASFEAEYSAGLARTAAIEKARLAKLPACCHIGMSYEQVKASKWGRPDSVNRTRTANHVREQWVYAQHGYLYFDDGVLQVIRD
jgi:hypothetical protein